MEAQTDQATPEYSAGEGEKRAFNKFYSNLLANHGVRHAHAIGCLPEGEGTEHAESGSCGDLNLQLAQEL